MKGTNMYNKIFVIGLNKQATRSIHNLFKDNGYHAIHWRLDNEKRGKKGPDELVLYNINNGIKPTLGKYKNYKVFSDIHYLSINFDIFDKEYPGSLFILNYRDINSWICSRLNHCRDKWGYVEYWKTQHNHKNYTLEQVINAWKQEYNNHFQKVTSYFAKRQSQLILYDIDKESLVQFASKLPFLLENKPTHNIGKTPSTCEKWIYINDEFIWRSTH